MSNTTHSRTLKTLKLLLLAFLSATILLLVSGNACPGSSRHARESVLKRDLAIMREAIDDYTVDKKRRPESLQALVDEKYLRMIPVNPVTHRTDWVLHYVTVDKAGVSPTVGVDDVHTGSDMTSSEGTPYSEW